MFAAAGLNVDDADNYTGHVTVYLSLLPAAFSKVITPVYWEPAAHGQYYSLIVFDVHFVMVTLCNRADHYIFVLWFLSSSSFFPRLISVATDWMSTILLHMAWP